MAVSRGSKISQQQKHRGVVVVASPETDRAWGFIEPAGSSGDRSENIFYSGKAIVGQAPPERGDEVYFVIDRKPPSAGRNRVAFRVWITKPAMADDRDAITTLHGADEYNW